MGHLDKPTNHTIDARSAQQLTARAETLVVGPARAVGERVEILGLTPVPEKRELVELGGRPWLVTPADDDPLAAAHGGRLVLPAAERERLIRLVRGGVEVDLVWIAHELEKGTSAEDLASTGLPAPPALAAADRRMVRAIRTLRTTVRSVSGTAARVAAAPLLALGTLDPVLLGGVLSTDRQTVCWIELARWDW